MTDLEKTYLRKHLDTYFEQSHWKVLTPAEETTPHIELLVYAPNEKYPFWKLVTMGASSHSMPELNPKKNPYVPMRNEYMMFLDPSVDFSEDSEEWIWYAKYLMDTALYPVLSGKPLTWGSALKLTDRQEEMEGVVILYPQAIQDTRIIKVQIGLFRPCACLQVMPVTGEELELWKTEGAKALSRRFYPEEPDEPMHPLARKSRKQ